MGVEMAGSNLVCEVLKRSACQFTRCASLARAFQKAWHGKKFNFTCKTSRILSLLPSP